MKAFVIHSGWLGKDKIEVFILKYLPNGNCVVKAAKGHPFDLFNSDPRIPEGAKYRFRHDTFWYDSKIVSVGSVKVVSDRLTEPE